MANPPPAQQGKTITPHDAYMNAEQLYHGGQRQQVVHLCEAIFRYDKNYPYANDLMARLYLEGGAWELALQHAEIAVATQPKNPAFLHTKTEALLHLQRPIKTNVSVRELVNLAPGWPEAWLLYAKTLMQGRARVYEALAALNIGLSIDVNHPELMAMSTGIYMDINQIEPARTMLEQLQQKHPERPETLLMNARMLHHDKKLPEAVKVLAKLCKQKPQNADARMMLGDILRGQSKRTEAIREYERVLRSDPVHTRAMFGIALALADLNQYESAVPWLDKVEIESPVMPELWAARAMSSSGMKNLDKALEYNRKALECNPQYADGYNNMGLLMMETGKLDEARNCYYKSLECNPHYKEAMFNVGLLDLLVGNLHDGWEGYAMRWDASSLKGFKPIYPGQEWDGLSDISDKTLLLYTEQGFGDCIQFIRYAALIRDRVGKIVMHCQPELVKLFETVKEVDLVISKNMTAPPAEHGKSLEIDIDYHQALLSLPRLLQTRLDSIPVNVPYIHTRLDYTQELPKKDSGLFKVAVTWSANLANVKLVKRNMPFANLQRFLDIEGAQFYNMQLGKPLDEAKQAFADGRLIDLSPQMKDFADTASLLKQVDLVVSVDTGLVHLCGAMDVPVWVMMPFAADWRWLVGLEDNIWYPSLRIMRQSKPHSWEEVLDWVERDLRKKVAEFHA